MCSAQHSRYKMVCIPDRCLVWLPLAAHNSYKMIIPLKWKELKGFAIVSFKLETFAIFLTRNANTFTIRLKQFKGRTFTEVGWDSRATHFFDQILANLPSQDYSLCPEENSALSIQ